MADYYGEALEGHEYLRMMEVGGTAIGLVVVETVVFATLVTTYFYLKIHHIEWPPAGTKPSGWSRCWTRGTAASIPSC